MKSLVRVLFPPSLGMPRASARAELVSQSLSGALGGAVSVEVAADYSELVRRGLAGDAALIWAPAGVCAQLHPVAHRVFQVVRQGLSVYRSAIVVAAHSAITLDRLGALRGLRAAWVDPHSLGGYLLAVDLLRRKGAQPSAVFAEQRFMGSHPEALAAVTDGRADLAAVTAWSGDPKDVRTALSMHVGPLETRLGVLAVTDEAPTDALVLTRFATDEQQRAIESLLDLDGAPAKKRSMLPSAMGADRYVECGIDPYLALHRRLTGSFVPPAR